MANTTTKQMSDLSEENVLRHIHNAADGTIAVGGFISGKVGHRITRTVVSPTIDDYTFLDNSTVLYVLRVTYNNSDHDEIDVVERTA